MANWFMETFGTDLLDRRNKQQALLNTGRVLASTTPHNQIRGLLSSDNPADVEMGIGLLSQQQLKDIVGTPGTPAEAPVQRDIPLRDTPGKPAVPGTGLLGGQISLPQFYAQIAGMGGDYTKYGIAGLNSLNPSSNESPSAVREYEFFKKLGPAEQRQFLEIKRAFQPYSSIDFQGGKAAFDKRVGSVVPLSTAEQEAAGQAKLTGAKEGAKVNAAATAEALFNLNSSLDEIRKMRDQVNGLTSSKGFDTIYGLSGKFAPTNYIPGTEAANSAARRQQLEASSFGISIQKMRGLGQLSDAEGKKVTAAYTRATNPSISAKEARKAWGEVIGYLDLAEKRANEKAGKPSNEATSIDDLLKKYGGS